MIGGVLVGNHGKLLSIWYVSTLTFLKDLLSRWPCVTECCGACNAQMEQKPISPKYEISVVSPFLPKVSALLILFKLLFNNVDVHTRVLTVLTRPAKQRRIF